MNAWRLLSWSCMALVLSGCTAANSEWLGRQLSGLDCRPEETGCRGPLCRRPAKEARVCTAPLRWGLGLVLGWCGLAWAQGIPVYDNTNFLQNLVTAAQIADGDRHGGNRGQHHPRLDAAG